MVDFRYHLVSLISVFIALALGVVLGAGPLQAPIASGLTSQVEQLRQAQTKTTEEIEISRADVAKRNEWIQSVTEQILPGTLEGRTVAIVTFEDTRGEDIEAIRDYVETAGGEINQRITIEPGWYESELSQFRTSLSGPIAGHLTNQQSEDTSPEAILSHALLEVITTASDNSSLLREMLSDSDNPLVTYSQDAIISEAVMIVGAPAPVIENPVAPEATDEATPQKATVDEAMLTQLASVMALAPASAVVVGESSVEDGLVSLLRADDAQVTTVDSVGTAMANASAVLALPTAKPERRAFGYAGTADSPLPPLPQKKE